MHYSVLLRLLPIEHGLNLVACLHMTLASPFDHCFKKLDIIKIMFSVMNEELQATESKLQYAIVHATKIELYKLFS